MKELKANRFNAVTNGLRMLKRNLHLFKDYTYHYRENEVCEECIFNNGNIIISFLEELREHEVNLKIQKNGVIIVNIAYRTCVFIDSSLLGDTIKQEIQKLSEQEFADDCKEVEIYIKFLQLNGFIRKRERNDN